MDNNQEKARTLLLEMLVDAIGQSLGVNVSIITPQQLQNAAENARLVFIAVGLWAGDAEAARQKLSDL